MRKYVVLFIILLLSAALIAGCAKEDSGKKLASRPVTAKQSGAPPVEVVSAPEVQETESQPTIPAPKPSTASKPGAPGCQQVTVADLATIMGGTWAKTSDCPDYPALPGGVSVCQCSYDGPKQVYVNVEVQKYDSAAEADRVYNMYCSEDSETAGVGSKSCIREKSISTGPAYVFVAAPSHFIKVSCLGGSCPFGQMSELAKIVEAGI